MKFSCPKCSTQLQAEESAAGKNVTCPSCSTKFEIPSPGAAPAPTAAPSIPKPNISLPGAAGAATTAAAAAPSIPSPNLAASAPAAPEPTPAPEPETQPEPEAAHEEHEEHDYGVPEAPRPIEYFYGSQLGNIAQVNFFIAMAIGIGIGGIWLIFCWLVLPKGNYLHDLFIERGWVQYATTLLSGMTAGVLILKQLHINKQKKVLETDSLPQEISPEINMHTIADFYESVLALPRPMHDTFMFKRLRKGLEYFYVRESNSEVATMMSTQSDIDANSIASSYAVTKVFLWAIPILGFIGTVLGMSIAISAFSTALGGDAGQEGLMAGLEAVLGNLGSAFDTTLLALVFSIFLMIPASSLQAAEEDVLNLVDEYANDNLVKRLNDGSAGGQFNDSAALKSLGEAIADSNVKVVKQFGDIHGNMQEVYDEQTKHYKTVAEAVDKQLNAIEDRAKGYENKLDVDISKNLGTLAQGIQNLNSVLKELDGKQIVVKKKGWFG